MRCEGTNAAAEGISLGVEDLWRLAYLYTIWVL